MRSPLPNHDSYHDVGGHGRCTPITTDIAFLNCVPTSDRKTHPRQPSQKPSHRAARRCFPRIHFCRILKAKNVFISNKTCFISPAERVKDRSGVDSINICVWRRSRLRFRPMNLVMKLFMCETDKNSGTPGR